MNRKTFFAAILAWLGVSTLRAQAQPETKWGIGRLVFAERLPSRPYKPFEHVIDERGNRVMGTGPCWNMTLDDTVEIGLRSDGVIVWRKAP